MRSSMDIVVADLCSDFDYNYDMAYDYEANATNSSYQSYNNSNQEVLSYLMDICAPESGASTGLVEKTLLQNVQHYLSGICAFVVCLLGMVGNSMAIKVMARREFKHDRAFIYLLGLTISDALFLLFDLLISAKDLMTMMKFHWTVSHYSGYTFPIFHPLANIFHTTSIWLMVGFTVDRYVMICHPYLGHKYCTRRRAILTTMVIFVCGCIYNIPRFLEYKTVTIRVRVNGSHEIAYASANPTELGSNPIFLRVIHFWLYLFLVFLVPCVVLCIFNLRLLLTVKKSRLTGRRLSLGVDQSPKNDTTFTLIAVVVVFLVCQLPALVIKTVFSSRPEKFVTRNPQYDGLNILQEVANFLVLVNAATNILLYGFFSRKFRRSFTHTFNFRWLNASKSLVGELAQRASVSRRESRPGDHALYKSRTSETSFEGLSITSNGRPIVRTRNGFGATDYQLVATFAPVAEEQVPDDGDNSSGSSERPDAETELSDLRVTEGRADDSPALS